MKTPLVALIALCASTGLGAALSVAPATDNIQRIAYACAEGKTFDAVFVNTASGNSYAVIHDMDELIPMQIAQSASGARYLATDPDYNYELWTKGDTAFVTVTTDGTESNLYADCTAG